MQGPHLNALTVGQNFEIVFAVVSINEFADFHADAGLGDFVGELLGVFWPDRNEGAGGGAGEFGKLLVNALEVIAELREPLRVELRAAGMAFQQRQHALRIRLRGAVGKRSNGNLDTIHPRVNGGQITGRAQAGGVVGVEGDGNADFALEFLDQVVGDARLQDARHVLDAQ